MKQILIVEDDSFLNKIIELKGNQPFGGRNESENIDYRR